MTAQAGKPPETLFAALAAFQASLPKIAKGNTAEVKNEQGKKLYDYSYADLADVNAEVLPRLGAVGLAFTSRPTVLDGQFVLAYSLVHVSGEREDGVYPLRADLAPQKIGGLITYARRYCLCAVTGVAAAGDDDDAAAAEAGHRQSAGDVFESAAPGRGRQAGGGPAGGQATQPDRKSQRMDAVPADDPWYTQPAEFVETRTDEAWAGQIGDAIDAIASREDGTKVWAKIVAAFNAGKCTPEDRRALEAMVAAKVSAVMSQQEATAGDPAGNEAA